MNAVPIRDLPFLATMAALLACSTSNAAEREMTKIVSRAIGPQALPGSFAAKPKTLYLAGRKYARAEEETDVEHGIRSLIITNEPDSWIINLIDKTGRHFIDPGPTFDVHSPIFWTAKPEGQADPDKGFRDLEFGNEMQFFREHGAQDTGMRSVDGKTCRGLTIKKDSREVTLLFDPETSKPYQIDIGQDGKLEGSIRYLEYKTGLPFKKSLFEPPKSVKIVQADASKAGAVGVVGRYKDLAEWAERDNRNSKDFANDLRKAHSAKEVAAALRGSAQRQRETTDELVKLVHAYPELRDRPQLGLDDEGLKVWQQNHPEGKARLERGPPESDGHQRTDASL